ncbi:hypothetical protein OBBRIDRAFT_735619 [Obba rivulosa]|uniref:Uncharacterized protein n=1 Tax=Obba rivulosa TaxID=1052685 RepID=A0A8E2AN67_9APHY|nr:hypothetical protein OBBRIDRAFT_735619 [Obba rivulosa]
MPGADGIPLVPPGLGLEDIQEGSSTHKIKPDTLTIPVLDSTRVTFGPGFEICQLVTGFESRQIFIERLPPDVTSTDLTEELKGFGEIIAVYLPERLREGATNLTARVTFSSHEEAAQAALTLNGESLFNRTVSVRLSSVKSTSLGKGTLRDGDVLLEIPVAQKIAYAGYNTAEEADKAIALANCTELEGSWVTAARHVGLPSIGLFNVRFQGLPPSLKREELTRYGRNEGVTMERLKYESLPNALKCLRKLLEGFGELLSLEIPPGPYKKGVVRGWARFAAARVADNFCRKNSGRTQGWLGDQKLYAHHIRSIAYTLPPDVFDVLEPEIRLLRLFFQESVRGVNIDAVDKRSWLAPSAPVVVKLSARDMPTLTRLKTAFEQLLRGEKLTGRDGEIIWEDFFSLHAGIAFLDVLQKNHPGTMLNRDPRRRTITLFGPADKRAMLGSAILAKVAALRSAKIYILQLPPTIIGFFMSADLLKLQQELGHENIWIDLSKRLLKVRGSEDAYKAAQLAILHVQDPRTRSTRPRSAACPVCLTEVTTPVTLNCGHSWCKACLSLYLKSAIDTKVFPLTCLGDGGRCSHRMPLRIAQELLSPDDFNALTHASFLAYVHTRPSEFHYCPTPDCTQIYRTAPREAILQCPSCLTRICPSCNGEYHENRRCQAEIDSEDQRLFEEWKASHDVKPCPGCKALIERSAGCNHMACTWCNTHICWVCLKTYEKADDVYEHMRSVHGGIGL